MPDIRGVQPAFVLYGPSSQREYQQACEQAGVLVPGFCCSLGCVFRFTLLIAHEVFMRKLIR